MDLESKEFMTGVEAIDKGHRQLIVLINKVLDFQLNNIMYDYKKVKQCLDDVVLYSVEHLDNEEEIMRSVRYPNYSQHFEKHNLFRLEINKILDNFSCEVSNDIDIYLSQISDALIHWLRTELLADDIKLAAYLKENSF